MAHPCPGPLAGRSTGRHTAVDRRTASGRRTTSGHRTACCARRTASYHRIASDRRTASGRHTVGGPERDRAEDSADRAGEDSRSKLEAPGANSSGRAGISSLSGSPVPDTAAARLDRPGRVREADRTMSRELPCRWWPPGGDASGLRPQGAADSATLLRSPAGDRPWVSHTRLPL